LAFNPLVLTPGVSVTGGGVGDVATFRGSVGIMLAGRHRQPNPAINMKVAMMAILNFGVLFLISNLSSRNDAGIRCKSRPRQRECELIPSVNQSLRKGKRPLSIRDRIARRKPRPAYCFCFIQ